MNAPVPDPMLPATPQKASQRMIPAFPLPAAHPIPNAAEVTAAVRRAAEAIEDAAFRLVGRDLGTIYRDRIARDAMAAGLDVEEMAREAFVADSGQDREFALRIWFGAPDDQAVKKHWRRIASAQRAEILGTDQ